MLAFVALGANGVGQGARHFGQDLADFLQTHGGIGVTRGGGDAGSIEPSFEGARRVDGDGEVLVLLELGRQGLQGRSTPFS